MKRFWTTERYRLQQRIRIKKAARRQESSRRRRRLRRRPPRRFRAVHGRIVLTSPNELSVFDRPDETLKFCSQIQAALSHRYTNVFLDLSGVTRFSSDALLLMRAMMDTKNRGWHTNVGGNIPLDREVAAKFKETGFFEGFAKPPGPLPPSKGLILRKSERRVYSDIAAQLVRFARQHTTAPNEVLKTCSTTLVEAMTNTHNHAGHEFRTRKKKGRTAGADIHRAWFASVYCEEEVAYFTFLDLGVGIVKSAPARGFLRVLDKSIGGYGEKSLLQDVFKGLVGSSTGLPGRGLGLPRMQSDAAKGLLPHLQVLTSAVIGDVGELNFRTVKTPFRGTMFRWQVGQKGDADNEN